MIYTKNQAIFIVKGLMFATIFWLVICSLLIVGLTTKLRHEKTAELCLEKGLMSGSGYFGFNGYCHNNTLTIQNNYVPERIMLS